MSDIVTIFKALADDTRVRVLKLLGRGELCVCEIAHALDLEQPRLSFHLRILKEAGIINGPPPGTLDPLPPERRRHVRPLSAAGHRGKNISWPRPKRTWIA